ncbi:hypothetical protein [uncultured Roseibium sp.]|uniref:peptidoglycan-binding domain-containing protein n=1 Tax=uncultured Roseibium sp. TaxID=1936171 RepID=UPI0026079737|nr:hypothetical protein [uncultured Roseibium sp.]
MSSLPKISIARSVGFRAQNNIADVRTVQKRLNLLLDPSRTPLVEDGFHGPLTKGMIGDFQSKVLGFMNPDQRVDPVGPTLSALNDAASEAKWKVAPVTPKPVPPKDNPDKPTPDKPADPSGMPKIPVFGPTDGSPGFDGFPAPSQVLGPLQVKISPARDGAWIMVPEGSERSIRIGIDPDSPVRIAGKGVDEEGYACSFTKERLLRAVIKGQCLVIKGLNSCKDCKLDLFQNGKHLRVYVSVKPRRIVPIFAFHVEHGPGLKSRVSSGELRTVFKIANSEVLIPQCNVELRLLGDELLSHKDIGRHLGFVVRSDSYENKRDEFKYLKPFAKERAFPQPSGADHIKTVNVFIVREMVSTQKKGERPTKANGLMDYDTGMCLLDDRSYRKTTHINSIARTLSHEVGHLLIQQLYTHNADIVQPHAHNPYDDALMYPGGLGNKLYRVEVEAMNPTSFRPPSWYS